MASLVPNIILLGAIQGTVLALQLSLHKRNSTANRLLAALVAVLSLALYVNFFALSADEVVRMWVASLSQPLPYLFGPLLLLYCATLAGALPRLRWRHLMHFLPALLGWLYLWPRFYARDLSYQLAFMEKLQTGTPPLEVIVLDILKVSHGLTYVFLALLVLKRYRRSIENFHSDIAAIRLNWLMVVLLIHATVWSLALVAFGLTIFSGIGMLSAGPQAVAPLGSAVFVFVTGYFALWQPQIILHDSVEEESPEPETPPSTLVTGESDFPPKYQRNRLPVEEAQGHAQALRELMETEAPHRNAGLTLEELADMAALTEHELSQVINGQFHKNFYHFINEYRVRDVKAALKNPARADDSVLTIAFDAGFNSKTTFNTFFKRLTGMTPTAYRRSGP